MMKDISKCHKDLKPGLGQCCCNCGNHYKDYHHPWTTGKSIMEQRGWICFVDMGDEMSIMHSDWSEHGMCELWKPKEEKEKEDGHHRCSGCKSCQS